MNIDKGFKPIIVEINKYNELVNKTNDTSILKICIERNDSYNYIYEYKIFKDSINDELNIKIAERIIKTILWICGGYKIYISGSKVIYDYIKNAYSDNGIRSFDKSFMEKVYEKEFEVIYTDSILNKNYKTLNIQGNLNGCRIGFDAGGSDRKVSAIIDGEVVYSEEVVWNPKLETNPEYHYQGIKDAILTAKSKLPRLDSIGVSSAGVFINNKAMVSSLFVKCDYSKYKDFINNIYINIGKELNVPITVQNDGDVTALAGAMDLNDNKVLGIAMGTSEAAGYVNSQGSLNNWLSELAFVPVDLSKDALIDEWSKDKGVGSKYFSQDAVIKLAELKGFKFDSNLSLAEKLKVIQKLNDNDDILAKEIFEDIGEYLAYTLAYYSLFYDIKHVLILGRVTSGKGGVQILSKANEVINNKFDNLKNIIIHLPDESNRRVGQSIAAASL